MKIDNYTHAHAHDVEARACAQGETLGGEGFRPQSFTRIRDEMPGSPRRMKKRQEDRLRLEQMGEAAVEEELAKAKTFSEALSVLGVGRKTFESWLISEPSRLSRLGRRRARPIWED